jgi:hypothetical protein
MQLPTRKEALRYFYKHALAQFVGFYVGMSSAGLVSRFFETRRVSNMFGLLARRPVVDAGTFMILQQIAAALIGFIVFEIVSRNVKPLLGQAKSR